MKWGVDARVLLAETTGAGTVVYEATVGLILPEVAIRFDNVIGHAQTPLWKQWGSVTVLYEFS